MLSSAPVASRHLIGQMLPDVVFGCLRQAIPDRVPAEGASCIYLMTFRSRDAEAANRFAISVVTNGGTGARPGKDGLSATAYPSGVKGTPVEIVETTTPLLFWRKEFRAIPAVPASIAAATDGARDRESRDRCHRDPRRLRPDEIPAPRPRRRPVGKAAYLGLKSTGQRLEGKGMQEIPPGERLLLRTAGGGSIGDARQRDASATAADLENGVVSPERGAGPLRGGGGVGSSHPRPCFETGEGGGTRGEAVGGVRVLQA